MTDFHKTKIGFALALLATAFAIYPIVQPNLDTGFEILSFNVSIGLAYSTTVAFLSAAVYVFALDFITVRPWTWVQKVGTGFYVAALMVPPLVTLLYLATVVVAWLLTKIDSEMAVILTQSVFQFASGIVIVLVGRMLFSRALLKTSQSEAAELESSELRQMSRARELLESGFPDMAVMEALKGVEFALNALALRFTKLRRPASFGRLMLGLKKTGILSEEIVGELEALRKVRNKVVHEDVQMNAESANIHVSHAERVLVSLRKYEEKKADESETNKGFNRAPVSSKPAKPSEPGGGTG